MSLQIVRVEKNGVANEEYILLQATADIDLNHYAVVDRTYLANGQVSDVYKHFFRFPVHQVAVDEYVALYTGKGNNRLGETKAKNPCHFFYWGSDAGVWNDAEAESAEVLQVATIARKTTGNTAPKAKFVVRRKNPYNRPS